MTSLCSSLAANTRELAFSIASRGQSEKMSQKIRRLAKELSRFTFPRTLRRSLAQTARLDAVDNTHGFTWAAPGALVAAQMVLRTCKAKEGRICHPEPSTVTPCTREVLHRACITSAVPARLASFLLSQTRVDIPRYARHGVHYAPDSARLSPPG